MDKLLTIVIPTYNMEKYLRRCLDSLLVNENQQLLEILVINDGSKDSSSNIAHEYEGNYPHMFRVIDKDNGNYGSCINRGLKEATGKYIKILDADDFYDTNSLELLVKTLKDIEVDLIVNDYVQITEEGNVLREITYNIPSFQLLIFESVCNQISFKNVSMHSVTYKRENLLAIGYNQTEGISYTDEEWVFMPMTSVKKCLYINKTLYKYVLGRVGQTMNPDVLIRNIHHIIKGIYVMLQEYNNYIIQNTEIDDYLKSRLLSRIGSLYRRYLLENNNLCINDLKQIDKEIYRMNPHIYHLSSNLLAHKFLPVKYILKWRKNMKSQKSPYSLLFNLMLNLRNFFRH